MYIILCAKFRQTKLQYFNIFINLGILIEQGKKLEVYTWGHALYGQLGLGSNSNERTPKQLPALSSLPISTVASGEYHSCALTRTYQLHSPH